MEREALARIEKLRIGNHRPQRQIARPSSAGHLLLELQRSIGHQAIQRLTGSPFIQAKLQAPVAVVQRDSVKITKKLSDNMSRAEVEQVLQEFFEKTMKAQGGKSVSMTED